MQLKRQHSWSKIEQPELSSIAITFHSDVLILADLTDINSIITLFIKYTGSGKLPYKHLKAGDFNNRDQFIANERKIVNWFVLQLTLQQ